MTQDDVIRTSPPICALDFGVPAEFAERAESYARWAVAQEREKRTGIQEFVTLPREVVKGALELWKNGCGIALGQLLESILEQPQSDQPAMTPIAQRKLEDLVASGYTISGYSVYHEQKHQHGFVTGAGLVGWWKPEGMEYPQPRGEQEPVAWIRTEWSSRTLNFDGPPTVPSVRDELTKPVWTPLYTHQQPKREPLTDAQAKALLAELTGRYPACANDYNWDYELRIIRIIEAAHNIK